MYHAYRLYVLVHPTYTHAHTHSRPPHTHTPHTDMVQLRLDPQHYSVVEGEYLAVAINVYNPSDENITVSGSFHVSGGGE